MSMALTSLLLLLFVCSSLGLSRRREDCTLGLFWRVVGFRLLFRSVVEEARSACTIKLKFGDSQILIHADDRRTCDA